MNASKTSIALGPLVQQFFTQRLVAQLNVSPRTVAAYRDAFRLLLMWFEQKHHKLPAQLTLADRDVTRIEAILNYLETERPQHNSLPKCSLCRTTFIPWLCSASRACCPGHNTRRTRSTDEALRASATRLSHTCGDGGAA
jgi:hypothetical protein